MFNIEFKINKEVHKLVEYDDEIHIQSKLSNNVCESCSLNKLCINKNFCNNIYENFGKNFKNKKFLFNLDDDFSFNCEKCCLKNDCELHRRKYKTSKENLEYNKMDENEIINLVETRGVGIYPFKDVIDEICDYIQETLHNNIVKPRGRDTIMDIDGNVITIDIYKFSIPQNISKKMTFINRLIIDVEVWDMLNYDGKTKLTGSGGVNVNSTDKVTQTENGLKMGNVIMFLKCISQKRNLIPRTVYASLYHEFNHVYDNFNRLKNSGNSNTLFKNFSNLNYEEITKNINQNPDINIRIFSEVVYRLFIPSEFNALVSSVYGELKGLNSKSYSLDYKKLYAYRLYNQIKNEYLPKLKNLDNNYWKTFHMYFNNNQKNVDVFKENFLKQCETKLVDLFHRINKTASLYYEDVLGNIHEHFNNHIMKPFQKTDLTKKEFDNKMDILSEQADCLKKMKRLTIY